MRKLQEPKYLFRRTEEEIEQAYKNNEITKYKWEPLKANKNSFKVPFGYKQDADLDILLPIHFELDVLEHAKKFLAIREANPEYERWYSLRKLADWVTNLTGRPISHQGIKVRINDDYIRQQKQQKEIYERVREEVQRETRYINSETGYIEPDTSKA